MKKGIYNYSPTLKFELGQIGNAFVNLCTNSPSLYMDEPLYESKSNNGLNLHLYVNDASYKSNGNEMAFSYRFSYDNQLSFRNYHTIVLTKADGRKEIFTHNDSTQNYEHSDNTSYIKLHYNEETCKTIYTLWDESERELKFENLYDSSYFLTEIKFKNKKKITISRTADGKLKSIRNELSRERIEFIYSDTTYTVTVYRDLSSTSSETLYQYSLVFNANHTEFTVFHRIYTSSASYSGFKSHKYVFMDKLITLSETREYITLNYSFTKSTNKTITQYKDENNNCTFIEYGTNYATVTNNRNDETVKYVWDNIGRLTHIYDLKAKTFQNINYDNSNHQVIKSAPLYTNKEFNPNYIGKGKELDYNGKINDLVSVILDVTSTELYKFKVNLVFKMVDDEGNVIEKDRLSPYDYHMINVSSTHSFVFSTFANIDYNHISVEVIDLDGTGTSEAYLYHAGFTENQLYKEKLFIGALRYGELSGITRTYERIKDTPNGSYEFDDENRPIKMIDINDNVTEIQYDENWNKKETKVSNNKYCIIQNTNYDANNVLFEKSDNSQSNLLIKETINNKGLTTKIEKIKDSNTIEKIEYETKASTLPFVSKKTLTYSDDSTDSIHYQYLNHKLNRSTFEDLSYEFNYNNRPYDELSNAQINSNLFVYYLYKSFVKKGIIINSKLVSNKTYANGRYYFEYDEKERLTAIKYSENKEETDAITLHTFTYETINHKDVIQSVSSYNCITKETYITKYKYDKFGDFIGKEEKNRVEEYHGFSNNLTSIEQLKSRCLFTKKDVQQKKYKMKFNQKIRSLNEDIKLCAFDKEFQYEVDENGNLDKMYAVLFNNIIDENIDNANSKHPSQMATGFEYFIESSAINKVSTSKDGISYINIPGNETQDNSKQHLNLVFYFEDTKNMLDSLSQTVAFMFKNTYKDNTSSILLSLKNYDPNATYDWRMPIRDDIHIILENKDNSSKIKVCVYGRSHSPGAELIELDQLTIQNNNDWHFVAFTYLFDRLYLFVDGSYKEIMYRLKRNFNMLYFGQWFHNNYNNYSVDCAAPFDLTNIMIPYKKALSNDRIKDIYHMFKTRNDYVSNELLDANHNDTSNTTFHTITQNIFTDNIEYISFAKTLSSLHGLKPKVDRTLTSLSDTVLDKFEFDKDSLNYAYKLCGQPLEYELDFTKYKDSFGVSFMLKVNEDETGQHNIMKFQSKEISLAIAYISGKLVFETTESDPKALNIAKNQWVLITLEMGKTIDNCSNQVFEYTFDLYINGHWEHRNKVQLDVEFEGFDELVFDFKDTHDCLNETPCLIKDMIITDSDFTFIQMNNMLRMNNKSYINTQFDSLGLKTKETICENGKNVIETTFEYETNTRFKDETIKLSQDNPNSRQYTYQFDDYGRVTEQKTYLPSNESNFDFLYNWLRYTYDEKGQLQSDCINHNGFSTGIAHQYEYDNYGNILSYKVNGETIHTFTYDEYNRMITMDNQSITYDDKDGMISLTPITIGDDTYSWQGRRLMSISGTKDTQFEYNDQGLRTFKRFKKKNHTGNIFDEEHEYVYDLDDKLICERITYLNSIQTMIFLYHDDYLYGFEYEQDKYFYLRDSLGTINGIIDSTGKLIVEYVYNAYGKIIDILGEKKDTIGVVNPMRYKGYYYDSETQMYYCKSRYYDPDICRWISGDCEQYVDVEIPNGLNLFVYCNNDPVNFVDSTGYFVLSAFAMALLAGIAMGAGVGATIAGIRAYKSGERGWDLVADIAGGAIFGAAIGATISLGGAAGLVATGASVAGFGLSTGAALGISVGATAAASMAKYSLDCVASNENNWNLGGFVLAGLDGALKGTATFGIAFVGGKSGLFNKLGNFKTDDVFYINYGGMDTLRAVFWASKVLIGETLSKALFVSGSAALARWLIDLMIPDLY